MPGHGGLRSRASWCSVVLPPGSGRPPERYRPGIGPVDARPPRGRQSRHGYRRARSPPGGRPRERPRPPRPGRAVGAGRARRRAGHAPTRWPTPSGARNSRPRGPRCCRAVSSGCASSSATRPSESAPNGYRLDLTEEELDHRLFERLLERARESLAAGDPARASYLAQDALELWRGSALPDLEEWEPGRVESTRLEGLRMEAEELLVEAEIDAGRAPGGPRARAGAGRPGAVPRTAVGAAGARAAPVGPAARGARRDHPGTGPAGRGVRSRSGAGAGRARGPAAAAGPVAGAGTVPRGQRDLPVPRPVPLRRGRRGDLLRPRGRRRGLPAEAPRHRRAGRDRTLRGGQVVPGPGRGGGLAGTRAGRRCSSPRPARIRWTRWSA